MVTVSPLVVLAIGIATVLGLIIVVRVNAFLALITAAMIVSLMAPGALADKFSRVAAAFGTAAGGFGVVIALAAIIGKCMLDSGAADRIVRAFLRLLGEKRAPLALLGSGYVLAIPVFFDTVFYLLVPLARSLYRRTGRHYLKYILAISVGGALTHTLVPPTPGPLVIAGTLRVDVGMMMIVGAVVAFGAAWVGLIVCTLFDSWLQIPMRPLPGVPEPEPLPDDQLPSLALSLLPVVLPVLMISSKTVLTTLADAQRMPRLASEDIRDWSQWQQLLRQQAAPGDEVQPAASRVASRIATLLIQSPSRDRAQQLLAASYSWTEEERRQVLELLNLRVLDQPDFYDQQVFAGVALNEPVPTLLAARGPRMRPADVERLNRLLLEATLPDTILGRHTWLTATRRAANLASLLGDANFALLVSAAVAMGTVKRKRNLTLAELAQGAETALMSAGIIILITAAGGAFGEMLNVAQVGSELQKYFTLQSSGGSGQLMILVLGFVIAAVLKIAQGSSTVAMITGAAMLKAVASPEILGFHPVYLGTAIGAGSLVGSWMNDSGFWIFAKMGGVTEVEALKSWTPMLVIIGSAAFGLTVLLAWQIPLA